MDTALYRSIGVVTGAHGVRGDILVKPWDPDVPWLKKLKPIDVEKMDGTVLPYTITGAKLHRDRVILTLKEITDRNQAEAMRGLKLYAHINDLPKLDPDEYYCDQLIGLTALSAQTQKPLGVVADMVSSTGQDFLEVAPSGGGETVLVPFQGVFIGDVDLTQKTIGIIGLDSLFEDEETAS